MNIIQKVQEGSQVLFNNTLVYNADAYDVINVTIAAHASNTEVDLVSSSAADVGLLVIFADAYNEGAGATLHYTHTDPLMLGVPAPVVLDAPQMFVGPGMVALFGLVDKIWVSNSGAQARIVNIIIGRKSVV